MGNGPRTPKGYKTCSNPFTMVLVRDRLSVHCDGEAVVTTIYAIIYYTFHTYIHTYANIYINLIAHLIVGLDVDVVCRRRELDVDVACSTPQAVFQNGLSQFVPKWLQHEWFVCICIATTLLLLMISYVTTMIIFNTSMSSVSSIRLRPNFDQTSTKLRPNFDTTSFEIIYYLKN